MCRGNFHSTYANSGAYDSVAAYLFAKENVDAFYLEYDDARSGGFEPLAEVADGKKVVLGLITTKSPELEDEIRAANDQAALPELEDENAVIRRIHQAERYLPLDRLCLSPQCGFASCEIGNKLSADQQWAKLELVKRIAERVWKD